QLKPPPHLPHRSPLSQSLGVSLVVVSLWISFSTEFSAIRNVNIEYNKYPAIHDLGVYSCISASAFLILVGLLCAVGTLKESEYLLGIVFFCFALQFCGVVQLIYWRYTSKELVENAVKDVYDFLYEDYMRNTSSPSKHHLTSLHSTFSCCGKTSVFSLYSIVENETCFTEGAAFVGEPQKVRNWCSIRGTGGTVCPEYRRHGVPGTGGTVSGVQTERMGAQYLLTLCLTHPPLTRTVCGRWRS
uniref:Tetraspanin n=1 Tax=Callorhinchus milii TaxID=7868 RepID=A0A4W3I6G9_CALMI